MTRSHAIAAASAALLIVAVASPAGADLASTFGVYVYPQQGQSPSQQAAAESQCYSSAQNKTGVNPAAPPPTAAPAQQAKGGALFGGARGAAAGSLVGWAAGNAGEGAAIGAVAGGLFGHRRQKEANQQAQQAAQQNANWQYQSGLNNFRTAFSACMTAQGYVAQ